MLSDESANVFQRIIKFGCTGPVVVGNPIGAVGIPFHFDPVESKSDFRVVVFIICNVCDGMNRQFYTFEVGKRKLAPKYTCFFTFCVQLNRPVFKLVELRFNVVDRPIVPLAQVLAVQMQPV